MTFLWQKNNFQRYFLFELTAMTTEPAGTTALGEPEIPSEKLFGKSREIQSQGIHHHIYIYLSTVCQILHYEEEKKNWEKQKNIYEMFQHKLHIRINI
jgi:hypothetical protein